MTIIDINTVFWVWKRGSYQKHLLLIIKKSFRKILLTNDKNKKEKTLDILKECYDKMGADYEDVLSRLRSEVLVRKFALKFLDDDSYANLKAAMESGNAPEAFRGAHTLKGVAQNLGFGPLYKAAAEVTESLRPSETSSGDMEKAAKLMPAVDEEYARTIAAIKEL